MAMSRVWVLDRGEQVSLTRGMIWKCALKMIDSRIVCHFHVMISYVVQSGAMMVPVCHGTHLHCAVLTLMAVCCERTVLICASDLGTMWIK